MRILAFTGLRYASSRPDAGSLAAPPFDQIGPDLRDRLHREPRHFARLTRPVPNEGMSAESSAAELHRQWLEQGLVRRDPRPALYPYLVETAAGRRRPGLCALAAVEPTGSGGILPHEQVVPRTVEKRLALLREMRIDLEPILLLCDDGGSLEPLLEEAAAASEQVVTHQDAAGNRHRLMRLDDPPLIRRLRSLLADRPAWIADGHHRYEVARRFARETDAGDREARGAKLAVVSSLHSRGLTIEPIHRGLTGSDPISLPAELPANRKPWRGEGGRELAAAVADARQPAVAFRAARGQAQIWELAGEGGDRGTPDPEVVTLHQRLLPLLGVPGEAATDGTVVYRSDPDLLWRQVEAGELKAGFWLPPMKPAAFAAAVSAGNLLPPKSTRFMPKLASGLVWAPHDAELA